LPGAETGKISSAPKKKRPFGRLCEVFHMALSRRKFLGWLGAGAAATTAAAVKPAVAASNKHFEGHPDSNAVLHDLVACVGCRRCEAACNKVNDLPEPDQPFADLTVLEKKRRTTDKAYTVVNRYDGLRPSGLPVFAKKQCNHCLEPGCASACFVKAFTKTPQGPVIYNPKVCVGCRYCMVACPFEIPAYEYSKAFDPEVVKCTMCHPRIMEGLLPGCVAVCPTEALVFGKRKDLLNIARRRIARRPDLYVDHIYGENEMGGTSWLYLSDVPFEKAGMRMDLGTTPAPALTAGALSAVPMIAALWPVLLGGVYLMSTRRDKEAHKEKEEALKAVTEKEKAAAKAALKKASDDAAKAQQKAVEKAVKEALAQAEKKREEEQKAKAQEAAQAPDDPSQESEEEF